MSFAQDNGYTPEDFETLMNFIREGVNEQFQTDYDEETFVGTNFYKFYYQLVQKLLEQGVKASEIFQKLQEYISLTNERIQRPSVSFPGLMEAFQSKGYVASVKPPSEENAGKVSICVDVDDADPDYAEKKLEIATLIKDFVAAGMVTDGTETESIALSNGQSFDFAYHLPDRIPVKLKLVAIKSANTNLTVPSDEDIRQVVFDNINARYRLGLNFEPQRYFTLTDAPWAGEVALFWSDDDGVEFNSTVFEAEFDELFTFGLEDISVDDEFPSED